MDKEIVTLTERFTNWKVCHGGKRGLLASRETIEKTPKPMTPAQALKYFKASWVLGITKN